MEQSIDQKTFLCSPEQMEKIQKFIQKELLKRGFLSKIIEFKEICKNHYTNYFKLKTEDFQTTPVIFESLFISNFGGSAYNDRDEDVIIFHLPINVFYEIMDGGKNSSLLFTVSAKLTTDGEDVYALTAS